KILMAEATGTIDRQATAFRSSAQAMPSPFTPGIIFAYVAVVGYALLLVLPLYWLFVSSFKPSIEILSQPFVPTFTSGAQNLVEVWNRLSMGSAMLNSIYITSCSVVVTLLIAVPAAYGLARAGGPIAAIMERI